MVRRFSIRIAAALIALVLCDVQAAQGDVVGRTLTSTAFPVGTITVGPHLTYVGSEEFVLYDVALCEIHLWVDAPNKRVKRLYWVQFEGYLSNNTYTYDYSDQPRRAKLGGHVFFNGVRFFNLDEDKPKWRPGSDYEHVLHLLESHGYVLGPEVMELALFRVDGTARRELMIIYLEDLQTRGWRAAELMDRGTAAKQSDRVAAGLRKRGLSGIRLNIK